jgi:hypothetical protein
MAGQGQPKTGGRAKGTPNKMTREFVDRLEELRGQGLDVCPIQILLELAAARNLKGEALSVDPSVRARAAAEIVSYCYPKRKAVELTGHDNTPIVFAVVRDDSPPSAIEDAVAAAVLEAGAEDD